MGLIWIDGNFSFTLHRHFLSMATAVHFVVSKLLWPLWRKAENDDDEKFGAGLFLLNYAMAHFDMSWQREDPLHL